MTDALRTGLLVLHGNRLEALADAVLEWTARHPLAPLEAEQVVVQSHAMGEWLKMRWAAEHGVCAAVRVELPARFLWRAWRAVLGAGAVPERSPLDEQPLAWRLMRRLPALAAQPGFEPVAAFLGDGADAARRWQLAQRLADLFDGYQVHRADWLDAWARGDDRLDHGEPVPAAQRWQPALWRALLDELAPADREAGRSALHRRFVAALQAGPLDEAPPAPRPFPALPRRIVVFGTTHVPWQTLEALAALAAQAQVVVAVPNPCRHHWADLIDGRELLRAGRRRHAPRGGVDLAALPPEALHAHGHPLLAAWGRQARDFVRQLDAFDDARAAQQRFALPRVDLFDDDPGTTLLGRVQAAVRDLVPPAEHPGDAAKGAFAADRSIVFHVAHGAQREVEILHDQLLQLLAHPPGGRPLAPRDIVVMVPDIETFAPAIRSVFGQHARGDPRFIPWGIADRRERGAQPLVVALDALLAAPRSRLRAGELRDLLDVPAVAARLGLSAADRQTLAAWIEGAGIRWGLDAAHREALGFGALGDANTWAFGLARMLLGYAAGDCAQADGYAPGRDGVAVEPYAEVAGLEAALAGTLAALLETLAAWWRDAAVPRTPVDWAGRLRALVAALFAATDEADRAALAALDDALAEWLAACEAAGFDEALELPVVREAWLGALAAPGAATRFRAGGVTFCTLLPLRAIPFEVVCLLGMNDGDYPRQAMRADFDLMALPGQARPGDRSRRDDDRQLMLDALLSARRVLHVSWTGRSARDDEEQPPSVLVAQLRDHLDAGYGRGTAAERTTVHPLQPFGRAYFEAGAAAAGLVSYASEWRAAHDSPAAPPAAPARPAPVAAAPRPLTLAELAAFVRNPAKAFFRQRLRVVFADAPAGAEDDEPFAADGLQRWQLLRELLDATRRRAAADPALPAAEALRRESARLARSGRLPPGAPGRRLAAELEAAAAPMLDAWHRALAAQPLAFEPLPLAFAEPGASALADALPGLRAAAPDAPRVLVEIVASALVGERGALRHERLVEPWLRTLAAAAAGTPAAAVVVGDGDVVRIDAAAPEAARDVLTDLLRAHREAMAAAAPWPTAAKTGCAWLRDPATARAAYEGHDKAPGEAREPCLGRSFPDFDALVAAPGFEALTQRLYAPLLQARVDVRAFETPDA